MATQKDIEQDEMIRQNAEHIRRNEEAITRQTECLEKIRDHYFPKKTFWKSASGIFLKFIGAVTVGAGLMETFEWYWNVRKVESMAEQCVTVARRLMFEESDMAGAMSFLDKAVELESDKARYRTMQAYVKGMATVADLFEVGRPLAQDERERVNEILSEAVFLQSAEPEDPMPYVLTAQAYVLRQEFALANQAVAKAVALAPDNVQVRCSGCAIRFFSGEFDQARMEIEAAERLKPAFPLVLYWKGMLALHAKDGRKARESFEAMVRVAPRLALPHMMLGMTLALGDEPDLAAARTEFARALAINPDMKRAMLMTGDTYLREDNPIVARIWYDRALACDDRYMKALLARAHADEALGDWKAAAADWSRAVELDPFREELYHGRAKAREKAGDAAGAAEDEKTRAAILRLKP